jgi:hypothetical protein
MLVAILLALFSHLGRITTIAASKQKRPIALIIRQTGLVLFSSLMEIPSSVTAIFLCCNYLFLGLIISFLLNHGRENFNKNKVVLSEQ